LAIFQPVVALRNRASSSSDSSEDSVSSVSAFGWSDDFAFGEFIIGPSMFVSFRFRYLVMAGMLPLILLV
jgi:hypothetical protein